MKSPQIAWIRPDDPPDAFPDIECAFEVPDGLLAAGGDLSPARLLYAYRHGIFPWFDDGQPILWWSPDPRCVMFPDALHISKRSRRALRNSPFHIRFNTDFAAVVSACAEPRSGQPGTWITPDMHTAYELLHEQGWAHSIEVWAPAGLVGGLYGLSIGRVFFGESMFSKESNASKAAILALCRVLLANNFALLDCQMESPHLMSLGATLLPRPRFAETLESACGESRTFTKWPVGALSMGELLGGRPRDALQ